MLKTGLWALMTVVCASYAWQKVSLRSDLVICSVASTLSIHQYKIQRDYTSPRHSY